MKWSLIRKVKGINVCDCDGMETFNDIWSLVLTVKEP